MSTYRGLEINDTMDPTTDAHSEQATGTGGNGKSNSRQSAAKLHRTTFKTSRLLEFCSRKELVNQTGHNVVEWPQVVLKELLDNSLDAAEEADVAPVIKVKVSETAITVADNGPGLPAATIEDILDYSVRVSNREAYVAPDRGAQGNALKCLIAMPFVLSEEAEKGRVDITTRGERHRITFSVDPVRQEPKVERTVSARNVKSGTVFTLHWPSAASDDLRWRKDEFLQLASGFTFLNPHLTLTVDWFGSKTTTRATAPDWQKWKPHVPTSPHWYGVAEFERLLAAYIGHDRDLGADRYVRDVVKEFRGLTGTGKQKIVLDSTGMARAKLSSLANGDGMEHAAIAKLLKAMKANSKKVEPSALGAIGKQHIQQRFVEAGCQEKSFRYKKIPDVEDGVPALTEAAFALFEDEVNMDRRKITGVNWSGAIGNPFRTLGAAYGDGLNALLEKQMAGADEPVLFLLHCACARVRYTDRGKTSVAIT